eukprot:scaffold326721_cov16-Prasinocladus_malaysianus.AAC.1
MLIAEFMPSSSSKLDTYKVLVALVYSLPCCHEQMFIVHWALRETEMADYAFYHTGGVSPFGSSFVNLNTVT